MTYLKKYKDQVIELKDLLKVIKKQMYLLDDATNKIKTIVKRKTKKLKLIDLALLVIMIEGFLSYLEGLEKERKFPLVEGKPIKLKTLTITNLPSVETVSKLHADVLLFCKDIFEKETSFSNYLQYRIKYRDMKYPSNLKNDINFIENNYFYDNVDLYINILLICNELHNQEIKKKTKNPPLTVNTPIRIVNFLRSVFIPLIEDHLSYLKLNEDEK